ncbi:hypothetical protein PP304_gp155 [Gordonia phage Phendrix]|uniref:Uncharacterized protein n=1 Tax=Gordonia phage Phendrix TaxID=2593335 RepID=A0A514U187_9CAUD|nr:hypothetical protein PP304_gp155 [Gordonia phage Phendrix]QDK02714.1 hypothetical protein SEA_PHENDRIX_198 [Gordonia phage Phendrix]
MIVELNRLDVRYVDDIIEMQGPRWYQDRDGDIWQTRLVDGNVQVRMIRQTGKWYSNDTPWHAISEWLDDSARHRRYAPYVVVRSLPEDTPEWLHTNFRKTIAYLQGE